MCGVTGFVERHGQLASVSLIEVMTDAVYHRGPDSGGVWHENNVALGHRRLSILDLSPAGHQPMSSSDGRWVLSFNGEIYNFKDLRRQLEHLGHSFSSGTDTEVLVEAIAEWGTSAVSQLNGMFAFAAWDRWERKLLLARDRYGMKPLYYGRSSNRFSFASEIKAILRDSDFAKSLNAAAVLEYFTFQNLLTGSTFIQNIQMLPAGHWMYIDSDGEVMQLHQYWDFDFQEPDQRLPDEDYVEELDRLFRLSVERHMVADVSIGSYLSGGIDSGSISAVASASRGGLDTFTCGFDLSSVDGLELAFDERSRARSIANFLSTSHHEVVLKAGDLERALPSLSWHLEEPRVGQSYPNYYAAELASRSVRVVLSGAGGDELFAGYPWRYQYETDCRDFESFIDRYYLTWQRLASNRDLRGLLKPLRNEVGGVWTRDIFRDVFPEPLRDWSNPVNPLNLSLYFEAKSFLHGLLVVEDKLSMAHGLETRLPFLDNDLVDFAVKCPTNLKIRSRRGLKKVDENAIGKKLTWYATDSVDGKNIVRRSMARYLPSEVADAAKQGFSAPDASWFRGESLDYVRRALLDNSSPIGEILDRTKIAAMVEEHVGGKRNRRLLIWSMLYVNEYLGQVF